ncbi:MAG: sensor histidine kinase, partial [Acidimicrobiales bacterium]
MSWLRRLTFRTRVSALTAAAVGVAVALAAIASYLAVNHQLYGQEDSQLRTQFQHVETDSIAPGNYFDVGHATALASRYGDVVQVIDAQGVYPTVTTVGTGSFDPTTEARAVATTGGSHVETMNINGTLYRVLTESIGQDAASGTPLALQIAEPITTLVHALNELRLILLVVTVAGIGLAIGLGSLVARATLRPVENLTAAAEHVAITQDLSATIDDSGQDELSRLAHAFNEMLGALGASRAQQAQLVSDAGHELRTPLTSLRTNIEVLLRVQDLPPAERTSLQADVTAQLTELTTLIGDVVELARQEERSLDPTESRLDEIVGRAIERARRRAPSITFSVDLTRGSVIAQPILLERAVLNVLDNAVKWSRPEGTVEVTLTRTDRWVLEVTDHGPGIAPEDLPRVFDRFYRAPAARSMPGSGLGLAIVLQVVTAHGGVAAIGPTQGGGTTVHIELPIVAEQEPPDLDADADADADYLTESTPMG